MELISSNETCGHQNKPTWWLEYAKTIISLFILESGKTFFVLVNKVFFVIFIFFVFSA
jgi:hypothetical protein